MNEKQYYLFKRTTSQPNVDTNHEHFYGCDLEETWPTIIRQFASFLDQCGYVGVYEKMDFMLEELN
tara:strand:+ start:3502 stop:3699 length:198 start_codon:yes stop_codon:yes gene_type:complete